MWTPRRVVLLLGGILFFAGIYGSYARVLGWIDGLPQVPERMLRKQVGEFLPPKKPISPTVQKLREAFGPDCPEQLTAFYPTQLEFRNRESSVVLAAGPTPLSPGTNRIVLAPFSLAVFGKPRPEHLRKTGEVVEISTFHADKAVLEFDQPVNTPQDMKMERLVRIELLTEPEQALPDPRRGLIHITNNQKSTDPSKFFLLRTPGPMFYRNAKHADQKSATGPDVWTDAPVEIVNRQNIPRRRDGVIPATAPMKGEQLRAEGAVPAILGGQRLPPPTITAIGMRIFLEQDKKDEPPSSAQVARKDSGLSGVRRVELLERVLFNLWVDARQGISPSPDKKAAASPDAGQTAKAAVAGGMLLADPAALRPNLALLQVETLGPFAYDVPKNLARFDVVPQADPNIPNDVQVTRIPPVGERQRLFTQVLEVEFADRLAGNPPEEARDPQKKPNDPSQTGGLSFKRLHAWTYTPGRFLTLSTSEFDERGNEFAGMEAFGQDLVHEQAANRSTLVGSPLYLVRTNKPRTGDRPGESKPGGSHVLTAGASQQPATLVLEPDDTPDRSLRTTIRGKGRMDLFDPNTQANTLQAVWDTSLVLSKEFVQNRERDLLTFTDGAKFEDKKAGFWLKANTIKVWLEGKGIDDGLTTNNRSQALPHRVQAIGAVSGHSTDFDIERADHLNVLFEEALPPAPRRDEPLAAALPMPPMTAPVGPPMPPAAASPKEPPPPKQPPKPPMKLNARVIDTLVDRYPTPAAPGARDAEPGATGSTKYELKKAWCEGALVVDGKILPLVHQDPTSSEKPRGLDIFGLNLLVDHTPDGSVMTVNGNEEKPGEVHHERTSILGPKVVIDQIHNRVIVEGRGSLVMPAGSELSGRELEPAPKNGKPSQTVVVVHWRDGMEFNGAKKTAEFLGRVRAVQNEASVVCHTMQVIFDRPVYFNQMKKPGDRPTAAASGSSGDPKSSGNPKVERVLCYPAPEDNPEEPKGSNTVVYSEIVRDPGGKIVRSQHVTARQLDMRANVREDGSEPYQQVIGDGPGTVRIWQPGEKNLAAAPAASGPAPAAKPQTEMKLTIVQFGGRMIAADKGKKLQTATFTDSIEVIHAPTDDPAAQIDNHHLPRGAVRLTCARQLVVSTYKGPDGQPVQRMDAFGNAYVCSDEYDGWGEIVKSDGRYVELNGVGDALAKIYNRYNTTENFGKKIIYDRKTGDYQVDKSFGGTFENRPKTPPPKK